jgi:hypothetical protein
VIKIRKDSNTHLIPVVGSQPVVPTRIISYLLPRAFGFDQLTKNSATKHKDHVQALPAHRPHRTHRQSSLLSLGGSRKGLSRNYMCIFKS